MKKLVYKRKFDKEVVQNVTKKLQIPETEVYMIYMTIINSTLYKLMSRQLLHSIKLPHIGSFVIRLKKLKTSFRKQTFVFKKLSKTLDGILKFDFDYYVNIQHHIERITKFNLTVTNKEIYNNDSSSK